MLRPGRAPTYRLRVPIGDLEQGSFVKPISVKYLPKHISEELPFGFDSSVQVHCYTSVGIIIIAWANIEEIS